MGFWRRVAGTAWLIAFGAALIIGAAGWHLWLGPHWTQRLPPGWSWKGRFVGEVSYAHPVTRRWPSAPVTNLYEREIQIVSESDRPRSVTVEDRYATRDLVTEKTTYEYVLTARVDPGTGRHLTPAYQGDYFVFPRRVERKTYSLRNSYIKGIPVAFEREDDVEGIRTYVFAYGGRAEYTESYAGTRDFEGIRVPRGQEIKCADDQFSFRVWIEPVTGETVKVEENCYSGDFVVDIATGKPLKPIMRWGGVSKGDDVVVRAEIIRRARDRYLLLFYGPLVALALGAAAVVAGALNRRRARAPETTLETLSGAG